MGIKPKWSGDWLEVPVVPANVWWLVQRGMVVDPPELVYEVEDARLDYVLPAIDHDADFHGAYVESRRLTIGGSDDDMVIVHYRSRF